MNRWIKIILLTLLVVWKGTATMSASSFQTDDDQRIIAWVAEHQQRSQAVISDSSQTYRICSSRPQRLIPVEYAKQSQRQSFRLQSFHHNRPLSRQRRGRNHIYASRLSPLFPCEYYVFALKRLLC